MSSFRSAWAGAPAGIAVARTGQSVPLLSAAAALAVAMAVGGWLSGARHASAIDATQIESWRAMVAQATEPQALRQLRQLARGGSTPARTALGEALLDSRDASLRHEGVRWLEAAAQPADGAPGDARAQLAL
ncbi:sel1 repeat family protein, partial [Ralstonia sp. SM1883_UCD615_TZ15]